MDFSFPYRLRMASQGNFTGLLNQTDDEDPRCSVKLAGGINSQLIGLSVGNIFLSITAFCGNALILAALHKVSGLHPSSKFFYRNLAISDFLIGIVVEPVRITYWISVVKQQWTICRYSVVASQSLSFILFSVSLLTMTAISIDRLLSLLLGIRYRQIVALKRVVLIVVAFWVMSIAGASSVFFRYSQISAWYGHILIALCLVTSTFSYAKIYQTLHQHRIQIQHQVHRDHLANWAISPLNMARYKKAVSTAMWIQLILAVCYIPQAIVTIFLTQKGLTSPVYTARQYGQTLIFLNSSLNPFFYFWKIGEVRQAVKNIVKQICCSVC